MERALVGQRIARVEVADDSILLQNVPHETIEEALLGQVVVAAGRRGKIWWLEMENPPWLIGHLGMTGWIRELGEPTIRLREHGNAPLDDENGRPRFLKLMLTTEVGRRVALTDGRRLARLWLAESAALDRKVQALGPDLFENLPDVSWFESVLKGRRAPIKSLLLNQELFAGVGNWIADELLYQSGIAPKREAGSLTNEETKTLRASLEQVLELAVRVGADSSQYPETWLFASRWGGQKGREQILGDTIVREPVGGRTTAWVPSRQK
jgi:formamidopyrimidine-DNA glycosylase